MYMYIYIYIHTHTYLSRSRAAERIGQPGSFRRDPTLPAMAPKDPASTDQNSFGFT